MNDYKALTQAEQFPIVSSGMSKVSSSSGSQLLTGIVGALNNIGGEKSGPFAVSEACSITGNSNEVLFLNLEDGRRLMVKRGRFEWARPRFRSARWASARLREESSVVAPEHLPLSVKSDDLPAMAYWYIPLPTLKDLWPELTSTQRVEALHSLGRMLREVHQVKVGGYGSLVDGDECYESASEYMITDLRERLEPAVWAEWPDALPVLDRLAQIAEQLPGDENGAVLVHNDLHLGNVLCEMENGSIKCSGLLDFEAAVGCNPEADLASAIVLHSPLFAEEDAREVWMNDFDRLLITGYGKEPDPLLLGFFRIYHLLNLGFFSVLNDDMCHAELVAKQARRVLKAF